MSTDMLRSDGGVARRIGFPVATIIGSAIAIAIMMASCALLGIYPFGDRAFLAEDLMYQYVDFFTWFQKLLMGNGDESIFYSTSQALGSNTWGLYSYYLGSPLNLLIAFFPQGAVTEFVFFVTAVKIGLIQAATAFFLYRRFDLLPFWSNVLALGFTWSSWTATQMRNPEWLDILVLLPLMLWGVHQLVRARRFKLLVLATAIAIICCWYTAYMAILFSTLYWILELWMYRNDVNVGCDTLWDRGAHARSSRGSDTGHNARSYGRGVLRPALLYCGSMVGALALAAFTFVPSVLAMRQSVSPELVIGEPAKSALSRMFGAVLSHPKMAIAALVGLAVFVTAVVLLVRTKRMGNTKRLLLLAALIVVVACAVAFMMHYAHQSTSGISVFVEGMMQCGWVSNESPQLYGGILLPVLAIAFFVSKRIPLSLKVAGVALIVFMLLSVFCKPLYVAWCGFKQPNGFFCRISFLVIFVMLWMAACFVSAERNRIEGISHRVKPILYSVLAIVVVADVLISIHSGWEQIYVFYSQSQNDAYVSESDSENQALTEQDDGSYRVAKTYTRAGTAALNEGLAIGYDELSSYSSAHDENAIAFLNDLGYSRVGEFSTRYSYPLVSSDSLLGVKYVYSNVGAEGYEALSDGPNSKGALLFENPYALALGYAVDSDIERLSFAGTDDPFQRQNLLFNALVGYDLNPFVECEYGTHAVSDAVWEYEIEVPAGCLAYVYAHDTGYECYVLQEGCAPFMENGRFQDSIYGIGAMEDVDRTVTMQLSASPEPANPIEGAILPEDSECFFYALDMSRFEEAIDALSEEQVSFDRFSGNVISGNVHIDAKADEAKDEHLVLVSVPHAAGWDIQVNGGRAEGTALLGGALTGIMVPSGDVRIEMTFVSPGFVPGCVISVVSVIAFLLICMRSSRRKRQER